MTCFLFRFDASLQWEWDDRISNKEVEAASYFASEPSRRPTPSNPVPRCFIGFVRHRSGIGDPRGLWALGSVIHKIWMTVILMLCVLRLLPLRVEVQTDFHAPHINIPFHPSMKHHHQVILSLHKVAFKRSRCQVCSDIHCSL